MPEPNFESLFETKKDRESVYKFKKEIDAGEGKKEIREFVSVLGVELEVNTDGRGTQFEESEFEDFSLDKKSLELLKIYAKSIKLNQPPLVEGPTDIGKSKALEYLAFLTNNHLVYQSFSGQTDVSELIGKYVPNTEDARKTFERILSAKNRGSLKKESLEILEKAAAEGNGLTEEQSKKIAELEGISLEKTEWVWQDGTVPRSMEFNGGRGCWLYFDELGAAEPQILVKLNRIFSRGIRRIEITENGGKEVVAGTGFRLIATTNPPSYAGREPFEKDFLRRWVYQKVGNLSQEDFLNRLDFSGHGRKKTIESEVPINLDELPDLDHIFNDISALFRYQAQEYLDKLPRDAGEQEFRLGDFTDALRIQEYMRQLQDEDLLETLQEAIEFIYLGKIDEDKKDSEGKNVKEKMRAILKVIIDQKKAKEEIKKELEKIADPEAQERRKALEEKKKELEKREAELRVKLGIGVEKSESATGITELSVLTSEGKEIKFELKEQLEYWRKFYETNHIDWITLPDFISITPDQAEQMKKLMEQGFDKMIIIPENLTDEPTISGEIITNEKYQKLHALMSQGYTETGTGDNYDKDGKFQGSKDKSTKFRIILTKDIQNLEDDSQLKATKGKSIEQLEADELQTYQGLSESEYLIYQREYFQRTKKHLDASGGTWLPGSARPLSGRVPRGFWIGDQLRFDSSGRGYHYDSRGCRLAGSFEIGI